MQCETCLGQGQVLRLSFPSGEPMPRPCPECNGSGLAHCCEGERPGNVEARQHPLLAASEGRQASLIAKTE